MTGHLFRVNYAKLHEVETGGERVLYVTGIAIPHVFRELQRAA
jgi:hypothetical protein